MAVGSSLFSSSTGGLGISDHSHLDSCTQALQHVPIMEAKIRGKLLPCPEGFWHNLLRNSSEQLVIEKFRVNTNPASLTRCEYLSDVISVTLCCR